MNQRFFAIGLVLFASAISGCGAMTKPQASPLTKQMSELNTSLNDRQITLDQYERAKHDVIYATPQAPATNAK